MTRKVARRSADAIIAGLGAPCYRPYLVRDHRRDAGSPGRADRGGILNEAAGGGGRDVMEQRLIRRSLEDDSFRQRLLADPRGALEQELGARLPEDVRVVAVEETPESVFLVLPSRSAEVESGELSERELETVAGGGWTGGGENTCESCSCVC